ncbi:phospholipase D-like domain-containing protein [Robbsia sp. Bb-Pol-6]|uniref:Cardiolipin synthase B n=1 Tax=Robbsia betulipollinis TaxID=2981849 RepID=A0ABT3ZLA9_9BURK|nr:phospholipase D-like domain-containing protein [Robbsia betulipollinis]
MPTARRRRRLSGWRSARLRFCAANGLTLLESGTAYFDALVRNIDEAATTVRLETYIFCHDDAGRMVSDALLRAATRGIDVRVITDGVGTARLAMFEPWPAAGIQHRIFNPHLMGRGGIARDHRKLAAVDQRVAYVGGMNIVDDMMNDGHRMAEPRWDFAVEMLGPVVHDVIRAFDAQWERLDPARKPADALSLASRRRLRRERADLERELALQPAPPGGRGLDQASPDGEPQVAFVARDNRLNRRAIERAYLYAIGRATRQVVLANPYFTPGTRLRRALNDAARRGVDVRLLIGRKEFRLLDWAVPSLYGSFLKAGVKVAEYDHAMLHGKVAVVDDEWATIGSSNLDALSLFLNHEANVVAVHDPVIPQLRSSIERAFGTARRIDEGRYTARGWRERLLNASAYAFYRLAMRVLTVGRYD